MPKKIGGAIGSVIGGVTDPIFGDNIPDQVKNPRLMNFGTPSLDAFYSRPDRLDISRSPDTQLDLARLSDVFGRQAMGIEGLMGRVRPGFSDFRNAGIAEIEASRRNTLGDLRQNLARRRVAGSSFAADDITRQNLEFDKQRNAFETDAYLKEIAATQGLINAKATAEANTVMQTLQQGNFEATLAANLASGAQTVMANNAAIMAQMSGSGIDRLLNVGGTAIGGILGLRNPYQQPPGVVA